MCAAFCKNPVNDRWYSYNDETVEELSSDSDVVTNAAYLLFYRRHDSSRTERSEVSLSCWIEAILTAAYTDLNISEPNNKTTKATNGIYTSLNLPLMLIIIIMICHFCLGMRLKKLRRQQDVCLLVKDIWSVGRRLKWGLATADDCCLVQFLVSFCLLLSSWIVGTPPRPLFDLDFLLALHQSSVSWIWPSCFVFPSIMP